MPNLIAKSKLIQVAFIYKRLEITKKVSRLAYYTGIGWASGKVSGNGGHNRTPAPLTGHMTYTQSLAVFEKSIFHFVSLSQ